MLKVIISSLVGVLFCSSIALAQTCSSYTYTLTNGTTADADQVMSNFNTVRNCANTLASGGTLNNTTLSGTTTATGTVTATAAGGPVVDLSNSATASASGNEVLRLHSSVPGEVVGYGPFITFANQSTTIFGKIKASYQTGNAADLVFYTYNSGGTLLEAMRLANAGSVTIPGTLSASGGLSRALTTQTGATYTVAATDTHIIANRAGTITLTLPAAASFAGRELTVRTITANTVVSASSDVVPCAGGSAGTAILAGTAGKWAMLVSDGTSWQVQMCGG